MNARNTGVARGAWRAATAALLGVSLAACDQNVFTQSSSANIPDEFVPRYQESTDSVRGSIWDLFTDNDDPNVTLEVNRYLWNASLDILNFMPVESVDPFSGVIVMGYGVPPGGGRAYRATVQVREPALAARSLKVAMATRSGPVDPDTVRAVEDAILTRARQLRVADRRL